MSDEPKEPQHEFCSSLTPISIPFSAFSTFCKSASQLKGGEPREKPQIPQGGTVCATRLLGIRGPDPGLVVTLVPSAGYEPGYLTRVT